MSAVVLEEHPVSNGNVWKQEEQLVVVRRWEHQEEAMVRTSQIGLKGYQATPRTWVLLGGR